jgi:hypothetical protein
MKQILKCRTFVFIGFISIFLSGCNRQSFEPTEEDLMNVIRVNFFEEYGGLIFEQKHFAHFLSDYFKKNDQDTTFNVIKNIQSGVVELNFLMEMNVRVPYPNSWPPNSPTKSVTLNISEGSNGWFANDLMKSDFKIGKHRKKFQFDEDYHEAPCMRNDFYRQFLNLKFSGSDREFKGSLRFYSSLCPYNMDTNEFLIQPEYSFFLSLYAGPDGYDMNGRIVFTNNHWEVIYEDKKIRL